jgi:hypothetical protein
LSSSSLVDCRFCEAYKRTVLVLWPESSNNLCVGAGDIYDVACSTLANSTSTTPTAKEKRAAEKLVEWCATGHQDPRLPHVVQLLRECGERWQDFDMFHRAITICGDDKSIALVGLDGFVSAYGAFGWDVIKDL